MRKSLTANIVLTMVNVTIFGVFILFLIYDISFSLFFNYDAIAFLTLLITCLAVILTGVGVFVAVLAVIGYNNIQEIAKTAAEKGVIEELESVIDAKLSGVVAKLMKENKKREKMAVPIKKE